MTHGSVATRFGKEGFNSEADAATWLYRMRTNTEALEAHLREQLETRSPTVKEAIEFYMEKRGKGEGRKTVFNELSFLRTALLYAWRNDRLGNPPKFKLRKSRGERTRVARPAEAQRLYSEGAAAFDSEYGAVCLRRVHNGMREGEIIVARRAWLVQATRELVIPLEHHKTGEDGNEKRILFSEELWELVHQPPMHPEFVFCRLRRGRNGKSAVDVVPWTKSTLYKAFVKLRELVGSPDLTFQPQTIDEEAQASLADLLRAALEMVTKNGPERLAPPSGPGVSPHVG